MEQLTASRKYDEPTEETTRPNSSELVEIIPMEATPFNAVRVDNKWFLALGKYRLTKPLETKEDCEDEASNTSWERLMQVIQIMINENKENKPNDTETN